MRVTLGAHRPGGGAAGEVRPIYRRLRCACCALDADMAVDFVRPLDAPVCPRCASHRHDVVARDADHVAMLRRALVDAGDAIEHARAEREFYRDRAAQTSDRADRLTDVLGRLDDLHHDRGARCSCGLTECAALAVLADPAVARLIGRYDEQQHTLRALRLANPAAWDSVWDYIDVTLVYPKNRGARPADRDRPFVGRHRAAG